MNLHATEASREHFPADMSRADVDAWTDGDHWPGDTWGPYTYGHNMNHLGWYAPCPTLTYNDCEGGV